MMAELITHQAGPAVSIQDLGRHGTLAQGLTRGGAMDRLALHEGAALLDRPLTAAIEMIGFGGVFEVTQDTRIALTGAPMQVQIDDSPIVWNASHLLPAGSRLSIGGVKTGAIGYLHIGAGFDVPHVMGAQSAHLAAGLGTILAPGSRLALKKDAGTRVGWSLPQDSRFDGGTIHITRSLQTDIFGDAALERFTQSQFQRDARANRQGIRLNPDGEGFATEGGLTVVSEIIAPGDIQVTGDGAPYVLMCESQTTGGYPRIATVIPSDLPRMAQTPLKAPVQIVLLTRDAAIEKERKARAQIKTLPSLCQPLIRDPAQMQDLLAQTLISGVVDAYANPFEGNPT